MILSTAAAWCKKNPTDTLGLCSFLLLLTGVALLSVAWACIVGGGTIFALLGISRVLGWDAIAKKEDPE